MSIITLFTSTVMLDPPRAEDVLITLNTVWQLGIMIIKLTWKILIVIIALSIFMRWFRGWLYGLPYRRRENKKAQDYNSTKGQIK